MAGGSHSPLQFLNNVLSQGGPNALPYEESAKWTIRQQLHSVVQEFPGLQVKPAPYTHNDGRVVYLLQAEGTIPMHYQGVKYNIPVTVWLLESFPREAPLVYVTPTRDMIIKPRHPHVDASGMVDVPYLREWHFSQNAPVARQPNLVDLMHTCSTVFGQEPPLYSRPASIPSPIRAPQSPPNGHSTAHFQGTNPMHAGVTHGPSYDSAPYGGGMSSSGRPSGSPSPYMPGSGAAAPSVFGSMAAAMGRSRPPEESREEIFRRSAINSLTERLQRDLSAHSKEVQAEMDQLFTTQQVLNARGEAVKRGVQELRGEKESLEQQLQVMLTNVDVIKEWLQANDKGAVAVDVDTAILPVDALSKQLLDSNVADLVIEDILYSLDKAVQEDDNDHRAVSVDSYLRHTRALARDQFFHRAIALKVRAAQNQAQVAQMAARAPYAGGIGS